MVTDEMDKISEQKIADVYKNPQNHMHSTPVELRTCCTFEDILLKDVKDAHENIGCVL